MAKKKKPLKRLSTFGELVARTRRTCGVDGTINGGTKVISDKGKKKTYNRQVANNPRNWED